MGSLSYASLAASLLPEIALTGLVLAVLILDLLFLHDQPLPVRRGLGGLVSVLGLIAAGVLVWLQEEPSVLPDGMLVLDPVTHAGRLVLLAVGAAAILVSVNHDFGEHVGEYFALTLLSLLGMFFMVSTENLLLIFLALELTSLSLYLLTAFEKGRRRSPRAALDYFLFGGISAAFTLYGISLLYGATGELNLAPMALKLKGADPYWIVAVVMIAAGFGFKIAAVPFHLWAPGVYAGAPAPVAGLVASGSKLASILLLSRVVAHGMPSLAGRGGWHEMVPGWAPLFAVLALLSMLLGNVAALAQSDLRRLLAFSAVAHAGYMLLGVLAGTAEGQSALFYYATTYAITSVGIFGAVTLLEKNGGVSLSDLRGLGRNAPCIAAFISIFLLSLAGIPPLAGFLGKFFIFAAILQAGSVKLSWMWLVAVAIAMSAVSLYYYLVVLKKIYVEEGNASAPAFRAAPAGFLLVGFLAVMVILLGLFPGWVFGLLGRAG